MSAWKILLMCAGFAVNLSACSLAPFPYAHEGGIHRFYEPNYRERHPKEFFVKEFQAIRQRRNEPREAGELMPRLGLALSGGGIRSNAFQLGLLSGLHESRLHASNVLKRVDYLSAVSGGSWAAGAYKISGLSDDEFFAELDGFVLNEGSKFCSESFRSTSLHAVDSASSLCKRPAASILLASYRPTLHEIGKGWHILDPLDKDVGYPFREAWRSMIQEKFLQGRDVPLAEVEQKFPDRPCLIVNGTHSEGNSSDLKRNFPFEFTSHAIGTSADCGNTHYCDPPSFRSLQRNNAAVFVDLPNNFGNLYLSHALAISGAVAPAQMLGIDLDLMEWEITFPFPEGRGRKDITYRKKYLLADGGHSENLGALPLMERNVDVIVISDAAFDPDERFGDYLALKFHAMRLLGKEVYLGRAGVNDDVAWKSGKSDECTEESKSVRLKRDALYDADNRLRFNGQFYGVHHYEKVDEDRDVVVDGKPYSDTCLDRPGECRASQNNESVAHLASYHGRNCTEAINGDPVYTGYYTVEGGRDNVLLYVKPPRDLNGFYRYLLEAKTDRRSGLKYDYRHIYNYLVLNKSDFPCNKTFAVSYDMELIHSYYLLGKYIAEKHLADKLRGFLSEKTGDGLTRHP